MLNCQLYRNEFQGEKWYRTTGTVDIKLLSISIFFD